VANHLIIRNETLQTGDPEKVAALYAPDAILLPTVSNQVRTDHAGKVDYFTAFLAIKPFGTINESHVRFLSADVASHAGVYTFRLEKEAGRISEVRRARRCPPLGSHRAACRCLPPRLVCSPPTPCRADLPPFPPHTHAPR
jgi:uncharacterized protein (TIGR02246 family)